VDSSAHTSTATRSSTRRTRRERAATSMRSSATTRTACGRAATRSSTPRWLVNCMRSHTPVPGRLSARRAPGVTASLLVRRTAASSAPRALVGGGPPRSSAKVTPPLPNARAHVRAARTAAPKPALVRIPTRAAGRLALTCLPRPSPSPQPRLTHPCAFLAHAHSSVPEAAEHALRPVRRIRYCSRARRETWLP
jgi:hypothetical protein